MEAPTRRLLREEAQRLAASAEATPTPARRARGIVADVLLWAAAALGTLCIVLVLLAVTTNISLIMFRTGSMSPAIPTGSVAVVQRISADQVHVGDVVTVDRGSDLPITHRVTSVAPGGTATERTITMRGDANAQDDFAPYTVSDVRIVRFSIAGIAPVIATLSSPLALGGGTLAAASLALWVFWPRGERRARTPRPTEAGAPSA